MSLRLCKQTRCFATSGGRRQRLPLPAQIRLHKARGSATASALSRQFVMASHGVARTTQAPRTEEQRERDLDKIRKYRALEDQARSRVAEKRLDADTFSLTSQLLRLNPEYYTIWNVRRRCLTSGLLSGDSHDSSISSSTVSSPNSNPKEHDSDNQIVQASVNDGSDALRTQIEGVVRSELGFTVPLLIQYPKCYWIWKYRLWILVQATEKLSMDAARAIWQEELGIVSKMLLKDGRNFHAWGYRRHVVSQLESAALAGRSAVESEFAYTTRAIHKDLSNFSAWHNRSQLIPRLLQERGSDGASRKELLDAELAFVRQALDVGPEDQSLWYYHHYLCFNLAESTGTGAIVPQMSVVERKNYIIAEMANIRDLAEDYKDVKWIYEALIEYTLTISQLDNRSIQYGEKIEVSQWLAKLRELDPRRIGRWKDFEAQLGLV